MIAVALVGALLAGAFPHEANLLRQAQTRADPRLTDGILATDGDDWRAPAAVELPSGTYVTWDLGSSKAIKVGRIQADNNDTYLLESSEDGRQWVELFRAGPVGLPGLQTRTAEFLGQGRWVRMHPEGGDERYSVTEVQLFAERPAASLLTTLAKARADHPIEALWVMLLLATALALLVVSAQSPRALVWGVAIALAGFAGYVVSQSWGDPAIGEVRLAWMRGTVAAAACLAVARLTVRRRPAHPGLGVGVLGVSGVLAVLCFINFGHPQFYDAGRGRPTYLHHYDMRAYFPIAKYFPELRFDGIYAASVAVIAEEPGGIEPYSGLTFRNLRTHSVQSVGESRAYIAEIRSRFDEPKWKSFVADMNYFRAAMTDGGFLRSMQDHGGNATPVWLLGARLLFARLPASDFSLWLGVAADCLLLALAFGALGWAYGPKTALVAMTAFGAMDFYQFGTNWFGAPLRHDWLALWCLGLACLKKERFALAGGLLAWSALIRAFPALTLMTMAVPVGWALARAVRLQRRAFSPKAFLNTQRGFVRVVVGVAVVSAVLITWSGLEFGFAAWPDWLRKVALLSGGHPNNIALGNAVPTPWLLGVTAVLFTGCTVYAIRDSPLDEAAAFGAVLVGIVLQPANYYMHCLFVLAILGREREANPRPGAWLILLGMCAGCFATSFAERWQTHFTQESWLMIGAALLLVGYWGAKSLRVEPKPVQPAQP